MYLGLDIGTSSIKALLIDEAEAVIGEASAEISVSRPHDGWSEQAADDWIGAVQAAVSSLKRDHGAGLSAVTGIGLSGQMHGATLIGKDDKPLRPCILWNDTRASDEAAALDADPDFRKLSGNIVFPGFTAPKLVWVKNNEPDIFDAVDKVLLPKDYVRLWLTGGHVSEMSDAAGTSWLDVGARAWSARLLEASGMRAEQMPDLVEGSDVSGDLRTEIAREWGIGGRCVVAGGAADNAAAACGAGIAQPGAAFVSLGTSGVVLASNAGFQPNPDSAVHAFCHAIPDRWYQMGVVLSATASLEWLGDLLDKPAAELTQALGENLQSPGKTRFLPYLSGERTPHNDASIRGAFAGIDHTTTGIDMTHAVIEGVAFALRDSQLALSAAGTELHSVMAVGGGSRSDYWLQLMAAVMGIPVEIPAKGDFGAALGAARLGIMAATGKGADLICTRPKIERVIEPDQAMIQSYQQAHQEWRRLYPAIKGATA